MFLELIATIFAGLAVAGVAMLLNKLIGSRLPRWIVPVAAGLGMIGTTIANEYGWYERTAADLPEGMEIALTVENQSFYRPWTQMKPYVDRFVAVDATSLRENPALPGQRMVDLYFFGRWSPVNKLSVLLDCEGARRASLADGAEFGADGQITNANWVSVPADDPVLVKGCEVS
ncbi:hypothetical protein [Aestuariivita boseongensis]|uniref:hypothetical protein n=1 Tax=Aestuariivita boseongensis TaxID=1470562 RepID=UPI00067FE43B|nr:hypothetical protein [Aestuariivita boseongensis]